MPVLEDCSIKFFTNGTGKECDTRINVMVKDDDDVIAALLSDDFGPFEQYSENGPFDMTIKKASEKMGIRRGSISIGFEPKGDAIWRFNFFLSMLFSDGSRLAGGDSGMELSDSLKELIYCVDEITR